METTETDIDLPSESGRGGPSKLASLVISLVILTIAGGLAAWTFMTEPTAQREGATKKTAMLVEVTKVEVGTHRPRIVATGTVTPTRDVVLRPQVNGEVLGRADEFTPGGFVEEGQMLLRLQSADWRHAIAMRESELQDAISLLAEERGRQKAARADYEYLGQELPEANQELVLRKPQLAAAQERVRAARAAVDQAKLNLRRSTIRAPFDAAVLERNVNIGSIVAPNDALGRLVGLDHYWVAVEVPPVKLRWLAIGGDAPSRVEIRNRTAWAKDDMRVGFLDKMVGALDGDTRMARVLAAVPDPLARSEENAGQPALMVGEFVEVTIEGEPVVDAVRLERHLVRDEGTVWVMVDGKLEIREVEVALEDATHAYVTSGLADGEHVVTTNLSTVVNGAPLRLTSESEGDPETR